MAAYRRVNDLVTCRLTADQLRAQLSVTSMGKVYLFYPNSLSKLCYFLNGYQFNFYYRFSVLTVARY